jgi:hypothetical protein
VVGDAGDECWISKGLGGRQKRLIFFLFGSLISKGSRVMTEVEDLEGFEGELLAPRLASSNISDHT